MVLAAVLVGLVGLAAAAPTRSTTIALTSDERRLVIVNREANSVSIIEVKDANGNDVGSDSNPGPLTSLNTRYGTRMVSPDVKPEIRSRREGEIRATHRLPSLAVPSSPSTASSSMRVFDVRK